MNLKLNSLNLDSFQEVRKWRNSLSQNILRTPFYLTEEMQAEFYKTSICNRNSNCRFWGLYLENILIACIGLVNIEWENRLGEISLIVNPEYIKHGYGKTAFHELLWQGFNVLNLENIYGECYLCSPHVGFWRKIINEMNILTNILPNRKYYNGKYYDSLYFNFNRINLLIHTQ